MPSQILTASSSLPHSESTAPWLKRASRRLGFSSAAFLKALATLRHSEPERPPDFFADAYCLAALSKSARASALICRLASLGMICSAFGLFSPGIRPSSFSAPALWDDTSCVDPQAASPRASPRHEVMRLVAAAPRPRREGP